MNRIDLVKSLVLVALLAGPCVLPSVSAAQSVASSQPAVSPAKQLKLKIAVGRFSNETRYGQSLLRDDDLDPLGKQAADILMAYLAQTGKFLLFERPDLAKIEKEQSREGAANTIGVDTLIIGSIVEFGRTEDGKRGLLNKERTQRAEAKVAIRLVDVRTGLVFHSATGTGSATTQTKTVIGIGSTSRFDGTLTDKALSVAVEDMLEELVNTLTSRTWKTDVLTIENGQVFVSGGARQGLKIGDRLRVMKAGKTIRSAQSGFDIPLPPTEVAQLEVTSLFGDSEASEGAVTRVVQGALSSYPVNELFVVAL